MCLYIATTDNTGHFHNNFYGYVIQATKGYERVYTQCYCMALVEYNHFIELMLVVSWRRQSAYPIKEEQKTKAYHSYFLRIHAASNSSGVLNN